MQFKQWFIKEDIFPQNNTATVFHRTRDVNNIYYIAKKPYKTEEGCLYGCGLYTTFKIQSQFSGYNTDAYGNYIVKFKVSNINKYLIFEKEIAQQLFGNNYKISDQIKKLGLENKFENVEKYDQYMETNSFSSQTLYKLYTENQWIASPNSGIIGVIYNGSNDGYCLLKYPPIEDNTISMLSYAYEDGTNPELQKKLVDNIRNDTGSRELIGWTKTMDTGTAIKSTFGSKNIVIKKVNDFIQKLASSEHPLSLELDKNLIAYLDEEQVSDLIRDAKNKNEIRKLNFIMNELFKIKI